MNEVYEFIRNSVIDGSYFIKRHRFEEFDKEFVQEVVLLSLGELVDYCLENFELKELFYILNVAKDAKVLDEILKYIREEAERYGVLEMVEDGIGKWNEVVGGRMDKVAVTYQFQGRSQLGSYLKELERELEEGRKLLDEYNREVDRLHELEMRRDVGDRSVELFEQIREVRERLEKLDRKINWWMRER